LLAAAKSASPQLLLEFRSGHLANAPLKSPGPDGDWLLKFDRLVVFGQIF
jgi:hypothetical protein